MIEIKPKSKKELRIQWMLDHQRVWDAWPVVGSIELVNRYRIFPGGDPKLRDTWKTCVEGMVRAGLISTKSNWIDVNIPWYVDAARRHLGIFN